MTTLFNAVKYTLPEIMRRAGKDNNEMVKDGGKEETMYRYVCCGEEL